LWRGTGLAQLCEEPLPAGKEHVAWEKMTSVLVAGRVWIADRGMASADYLAWRRQSGRRYIIGAPKSELRKFSAPLAEAAGWREIREGIEVKLTPCPETGETVILCRSVERRSKACGAREVQPADRGCSGASGGSHCPLEQAPRSDASEPADRSDPATKPTRRRAL
jgi:hypothetical protein